MDYGGQALARLHVEALRNVSEADLVLHPQITVITGGNGAGKSTLLEAIHCLSRGRGFRPGHPGQLVQHGKDGFLVRGIMHTRGAEHRLVARRKDGTTELRINGKTLTSARELAALLPAQVITTESQRLLTDGPSGRRALLNWGVFHVEHGFGRTWQRYRRALRQRNAALRQSAERSARACEAELCAASEAVRAAHARYLDALHPYWEDVIQRWMTDSGLRLRYRCGIPDGEDQATAMQRRRPRELERGYTLAGPHRADLRVTSASGDAQYILSRGQQKLAVIALKLAQLGLHRASSGGRVVVLVDDLAAELGREYRQCVLEELLAREAQVVLTSIEAGVVPIAVPHRSFHVEQGRVTEVIQ